MLRNKGVMPRGDVSRWPVRSCQGAAVRLLAVVLIGALLIGFPAGAGATRVAHFAEPVAVAVGSSHVWVANVSGNSIAELDESTGSVVRVIDARVGDLQTPVALAVDRARVWVVNEGVRGDPKGTGSITELNARTGALVRVITLKAAQFDNPAAIAIGDSHVWVTNLQTSSSGGSVTDLDERDGSITRVVDSLADVFDGPLAIAVHGNDVWIVSSGVKNYYGNGRGVGSVTEIDAATGDVLRVITAQSAPFDEPTSIVISGSHVWVANLVFSSIVELNALNGSVVRLIRANSLNEPLSMAVDAKDLWVANFFGNSVTEIAKSTGAVVRVIGAGIDEPGGIAVDGSHVWVTDGPNNEVTELDEANGKFIRAVT